LTAQQIIIFHQFYSCYYNHGCIFCQGQLCSCSQFLRYFRHYRHLLRLWRRHSEGPMQVSATRLALFRHSIITENHRITEW